jgi:hypothetical protein
MLAQTVTEIEVIIAEQYAVELEKTSRGYIAELKDAHHPLNGTYAHGSTASCTLAALKAKVRELQAR